MDRIKRTNTTTKQVHKVMLYRSDFKKLSDGSTMFDSILDSSNCRIDLSHHIRAIEITITDVQVISDTLG